MPKKQRKMKGSKPRQTITANDEYEFLDLEPIEVKKAPAEQLDLNETQLKEQFTRNLIAVDPQRPPRTVRFDYATGEFHSEPTPMHLVTHFSMMGSLIHKENAEYKDQVWDEKWRTAEPEPKTEAGAPAAGSASGSAEKEAEDGEKKEADDGEAKPKEGEEKPVEKPVERKSQHPVAELQSPRRLRRLIKNQFNFSERAAQTFNMPLRDRNVATEPPPITMFSQTACRAEIFDSYLTELLRNKQVAENKESKNNRRSQNKKSKKKEAAIKYADKDTQILNSSALLKAFKIMERCVNMNAEKSTYADFKYFKGGEAGSQGHASVLPLWTIKNNSEQEKAVTAIAWNPGHTDLFAVGYGSYDFMRQTKGMIHVYSLKNTSNPEYKIQLNTGVVGMDFHPDHHNLLCVGCYNGNVAVYDVQGRKDMPIYISTCPESRHTDPVWNVRWNRLEIGVDLNFFSVANDGRVVNWWMSKNELQSEDVMELANVIPKEINEEDSNLLGLASACCFDWSPVSEGLFLIGSEEGQIHQCNRNYPQSYVKTYAGHKMPVYAVRWNPAHPKTFLSCSEDWSVKLWDADETDPIITYDLNHPVGDVAWAPFSATVFAAVTTDGRVHVFDLSQNKNGPLASARVTSSKKGQPLTHVAFSPKDDILVVGDNQGTTTVLKLSEGLATRMPSTGEEDEVTFNVEAEADRLEKILKVTGSKVMDLTAI